MIAADAETNAHAGLQYSIGDVWEIQAGSDPNVSPPHVENILVLHSRRVRPSDKVEETIERFMPPVCGGPETLFEGLTQATQAGTLYVAESTGLPHRSTMFWKPDRPLQLDAEGKRIRYRYPSAEGGRTLTFVGFQEPLAEIPAGTLLRVSLAHRWRPKDRPEDELRCFLQLSGWFLRPSEVVALPGEPAQPAGEASLTAGQDDCRSADPAQAHELLKRTFGFSRFLPVQAEVVARVLRRQDTLVIMPTGGGKSVCYQLPALAFDGLTVVISPLVALMQDQVRQLRELDVPAACLNHMVPLHEWITIAHAARRGEIKLLYLAPETLLKPETLLLLEASHVACIAVDEAHCISESGPRFSSRISPTPECARPFPARGLHRAHRHGYHPGPRRHSPPPRYSWSRRVRGQFQPAESLFGSATSPGYACPGIGFSAGASGPIGHHLLWHASRRMSFAASSMGKAGRPCLTTLGSRTKFGDKTRINSFRMTFR